MTVLSLLLACAADDYETGATPTDTATLIDPATTGSTPTGDEDKPLVGTWLSEGENVAALLAGDPFNIVSVTATFGGDGSYTVVSVDDGGQSGTLTGTYGADESTDPATIVLSQATPYTATAEGIYAISGATLTYEVVQTQPDYGYAPPTPESGFGTTSGNGIEAGINVQTFVWVD